MNLLQKAQISNGLASFISGIGMMIFKDWLAELFQISTGLPFLIFGAIITYFSITIFYEVKKQRYKASYWIIIQDALWVILSALVLLIKPFDISSAGYELIGWYALPVILFVFLQAKGLKVLKEEGI